MTVKQILNRGRLKPLIIGVVAVFLLGACEAKLQKFSERTEKSRIEGDSFYAGDGHKLPLRTWHTEHPKAVIIAVHGFNDYSHAFEMPGEYFKQNDVSFYAIDQRGFGHTERFGIWAGRENLTHDLGDFLKVARAKYPHTPIYVMGESMGGAVVILASAEGKLQGADGLILIGPAVWGGKGMNPFYRATLWVMVRLFPGLKLTGEGTGVQASDNIEMLKELGRDPLFIKATRVDAINGVVSLMGDALEQSAQIKNPALLLYGKKDQIIPRKPVEKFVAGMDGSHKVIWYDEGWHMLLRDLQRENVYKDILEWIDEMGEKN